MAERPVIFSGSMVRAILGGRKTMTRRLATSPLAKCQPGDRLWVRESLRVVSIGIEYAADSTPVTDTAGEWPNRATALWVRHAHYGGPDFRSTIIPSIHMPRWASRITLEVKAVKVEPLQDITEEDAEAEGCRPSYPFTNDSTARRDFRTLWRELHGPGAWDTNPEVVAISFLREIAA